MTLDCPMIFLKSIVLYLALCTLTYHAPVSCLAQNATQAIQGHSVKHKRSSDDDVGLALAGFLLARPTDQRLNPSNALDSNLSKILDRTGPDMRPSRDCNDFKDISPNVSVRAWDLLHERVKVAITQRIETTRPIIERLLNDAGASQECVNSIQKMLAGATRMESWAVKMLNSWGTFPMSGIFDGTYGDLGSFDTCVDVRDNQHIDHAHYCTVTFRPIIPSTKDHELIVRKVPDVLRYHFELARSQPNVIDGLVSERDAFSDLLEHAQYHHFVYYKIGTCWPVQCSPFDVKRLAKLIGRRNILTSGPVKCYSKNESDYEQPDQMEVVRDNSTVRRKLSITTVDKHDGIFIWKPHFLTAQKVAYAIIAGLTVFILFFTLADICLNRMPVLLRVITLSLKGLPISAEASHELRHQYSSVPRAITSSFAICGDAINQHNQHHGPSSSYSSSMTKTRRQMHHPPALKLGLSMMPHQQESESSTLVQTSLTTKTGSTTTPIPTRTIEEPTDWLVTEQQEPSLFMSLVDDFSAVRNVAQFFRVSENQMRTDILCLNGIRCITMVWIIMAHTMMFNDWGQFARTRTIELALNSVLSQPLFNASYLVDTFFLMSGLLSAFTAFKHSQGIRAKFNSLAYIFGRWLRLTPQIFFVSMTFIIWPTLSYGPHWYPMVGEYSENCVKNWWINVLHVQSFYRKEEMCNFVTWWISIDFFYHFFALAIIWIIMLAGHKSGFMSIGILLLSCVGYQSYKHYDLGIPPNLFSTIPQTGATWTSMTLEFIWTPYTHAVPFFFGFYTGYLMALKKKLIIKELNTRRALIGWMATVVLLALQSISTYWWVTGKAEYSRLVSTLYYGSGMIIWSGCISWIVIACQYGYGGFVNRILSWKVFIVLGKASYLIYLSHFQILFLWYGNQSVFLEPSTLNMLYIIFGNIILSTLYGILLCSVYEIPWLKMHRRLMKYV